MDSSKNDIITNMRISLEKAQVEGVPEYIKNLQANSIVRILRTFILRVKQHLCLPERVVA